MDNIRNSIDKTLDNQAIHHFSGFIQGEVVGQLIKLAESKGSELNPHILTHRYLLSDDGDLLRFDWSIKSILSENTQAEDISS